MKVAIQVASVALLATLHLSLAGCFHTQTCPEIIPNTQINKVYPITPQPVLREVVIRKINDDNVIAGVTQQDIDSLVFNVLELLRWGETNAATLQIINKADIQQVSGKEK